MERLTADLATLRRAGQLDGWALRRTTEPLVAHGRLALALGQFTRGDARVALMPLASAPAAKYLEQLDSLATATPLVAIPLAETSDSSDTAPTFESLR